MNESINRFIPAGDARESHEIIVHAPAQVVLDLAEHFDIESVFLARSILWLRAKIFRAPWRRLNGGLVEMTTSLGWAPLARTPGRELVMGAVTQPWVGEVKFRSVPADAFAAFNEPGLVKIVWTLEAEPLAAAITRLRTQTRAAATDETARRKFGAYWNRYSIGVRLLRRLLLRAVKREAERRFKSRMAPLSPPATQAH
jgi:hypothetical protein